MYPVWLWTASDFEALVLEFGECLVPFAYYYLQYCEWTNDLYEIEFS